MVFLREEVDVSRGDDAHELAAHLARLGDGDAREAVAHLGLKHVAHRVPGAHHHRVCDEALLKFLQGTYKRSVLVLLIWILFFFILLPLSLSLSFSLDHARRTSLSGLSGCSTLCTAQL